jgi:hypothetical protein
MAVINADDLMGVTVENPIAERNDISDLENEIDYPSQKEVNVARVDYPSWAVDTRNVESTGPPHQVSTTADRIIGAQLLTTSPPFARLLPRSSTQARTPAEVNIVFARSATDSLRASLALAEEGSAMHNAISAALAYRTSLLVDHHLKLEVS